MIRAMSWICFAMAVAGAGWGWKISTAEAPREALLVAADAEHDLGKVSRGRHDMTSSITNPANRPVRLLGFGCHPLENCCYGLEGDGLPKVIGPGETYPIGHYVLLRRAGPFAARMTVYFEYENGIREATLSVRGECVTPPRAKKPGDNPFAIE